MHTCGTQRPFLRWAGGKSKFVGAILAHMPTSDSIGTYYEPFLGAGAVFLAYTPRHAVLCDLNSSLISTFEALRDAPARVWNILSRLRKGDSEAQYYKVRGAYNAGGDKVLQAARFIYLNQSCFNGIFRVNRKGQFNVPYGFKQSLRLLRLDELTAISVALRNVTVKAGDYRACVAPAARGDLVYFDPPYPPLNGTSYFTHYTKERFSDEDQVAVAETATMLARRGCSVVVTNADTELIRRLYRGWSITDVSRPRWITSSNHKHRVNELIIVNR